MRLGTLGIAMFVVACAAGSAFAASPAQTKTTKSYVFKLEVGNAEQMWTPAQVRGKHPKTGERRGPPGQGPPKAPKGGGGWGGRAGGARIGWGGPCPPRKTANPRGFR